MTRRVDKGGHYGVAVRENRKRYVENRQNGTLKYELTVEQALRKAGLA